MSNAQTANPNMKDVLSAVKSGVGTQSILLAGTMILLGVSVISNVTLSSNVAKVAKERPVYVVPGAVEGVYAPGLTKYNTTNAVRYLVSLGTNLTPANAKARLSELERYCAPEYLPAYQKDKARLLNEISTQNQSRAVQPDEGDRLTKNEKDGTYSYTMTGTWSIMSGTIMMSNYKHSFSLDFKIGSASAENPYGIVFHSLKFIQLEGPNGRQSSFDKAPV